MYLVIVSGLVNFRKEISEEGPSSPKQEIVSVNQPRNWVRREAWLWYRDERIKLRWNEHPDWSKVKEPLSGMLTCSVYRNVENNRRWPIIHSLTINQKVYIVEILKYSMLKNSCITTSRWFNIVDTSKTTINYNL